MQRDYLVYPSMVGAQAGVIWSYNDESTLSTFDDIHPLTVSANKCNDSSFCLWYLSPLWTFADSNHTQYALLGELNKWTAVSRQRFISLTTNTERTQTTIILHGAFSEMVQLLVYHSKLASVRVTCSLSSGQAQLIITPSTVTCSKINFI